MKALTISQPYASLIASGEKFIENRCWSTNYRGPLAIHAGLGRQYLTKAELGKYPTGCFVAVANLTGCVNLFELMAKATNVESYKKLVSGTEKTWYQILMHKHSEGPWCWILEDIRKLDDPIPAKGKQGLWSWDELSLCETSN